MGYLAHGAFFTLCPHLPALTAPKPKRKYKRRYHQLHYTLPCCSTSTILDKSPYMRKGGKSRRGQNIPRVPLVSFFKNLKNPGSPFGSRQFSICSRGSKNQGSPLGLFFYQLTGVSQKNRLFSKNLWLREGQTPVDPPCAHICKSHDPRIYTASKGTGNGTGGPCFTQDSGTGTVNYPDPKDYLSQELRCYELLSFEL